MIWAELMKKYLWEKKNVQLKRKQYQKFNSELEFNEFFWIIYKVNIES